MYKVLIIDDDKLARKGLISMIDWIKYDLEVVGDVPNGIKALEFLEKNDVDLAFVDISMPVLSGMDFIKDSRQKYPKLKYVILTFHEDFENVQNALRYGVLDYISKLRLEEMDCEEVFERIRRLMDESEKTSRNETDQSEIIMKENLIIAEEELNREKLEEVRLEWCSCKWVYRDDLFEKLISDLEKSPVSKRQIERLLMWIAKELEDLFEIVISTPYLCKNEEGIEWIRFCREKLYKDINAAGGYYNMQICILRTVIYIKDNIGKKLNAEMVAGQINMSRSYFSVNFKQVVGETFNDFLKEERILLAKKILQREDVRVTELAGMVGYEDFKYFAKIFFNETGMNCSEYAKQFSS